MALVFAMGLTLAACSSSTSSSTDDALSTPGSNYLGTIRVDVNPAVPSITVIPVAHGLSDTTIDLGAGTVHVSTTNIAFAAGTITGDMKILYDGADRLEDVSIRVIDAPGTAATATIDNDDSCGAAPMGAAIGGGCNPGITYVGDEGADGPETEIEMLFAEYVTSLDDITTRASRNLRVMCPNCGMTTALWSMTENTAGWPAYSFTANVYGTAHAANIMNDTRYDPNYPTTKVFPYKPDWPAGANPGIDSVTGVYNTVSPGEWFYAGIWYDYAGANRAGTTLSADGPDGNAISYQNPGDTLDNKDYYFVEDADNIARYASRMWSTSFAYISNSGYLFMAGGNWMIRWDPAVLATNDTQYGSAGWWGSGKNLFKTRGATGTFVGTNFDADGADAFASADGDMDASNFANRSSGSVEGSFNFFGSQWPAMPDGVDDYGDFTNPANFTQGDLLIVRIALKAIGASGEGSRLSFEPGGQVRVWVARGNYMSTGAGIYTNNGKNNEDQAGDLTGTFPAWSDHYGLGSAPDGVYNEQVSWVCIQ